MVVLLAATLIMHARAPSGVQNLHAKAPSGVQRKLGVVTVISPDYVDDLAVEIFTNATRYDH